MTLRKATANETRDISAKLRQRGLHYLASDFEAGRMTFTALDGAKLTTGSLTPTSNATAISHSTIAAEIASTKSVDLAALVNDDEDAPTAAQYAERWGTFKPAEQTTERTPAPGDASRALAAFIDAGDDDAPAVREPAILRRHLPGSSWDRRNAQTRGTTSAASSTLQDFIDGDVA